VFGKKIRSAGLLLLPSFGTIGDGLDDATMESFWSSMQIELLNRRTRKTRVELANAIFKCIEISTTANDATPPSATAPRSHTNYCPPKIPSPQSVSQPHWNKSGGSGPTVS
jgi:hypothetical protein